MGDSLKGIELGFNESVVGVVVVIVVVIVPIPVFFPKSAFRHSTSDWSFRPQEHLGMTNLPRALPQAEIKRPFRPLPTTACLSKRFLYLFLYF